LSARTFDAPGELAERGIHFVLLDEAADESDAARAFRLSAVTALDQRAGFVKVGETDKGVLWRLDADPSDRARLTAVEEGTARLIITIQLVVLFSALLLSIPTRASRRAARAQSRIVGRSPEEPLVLPRRATEQDLAAGEPVSEVEPEPAPESGPDAEERTDPDAEQDAAEQAQPGDEDEPGEPAADPEPGADPEGDAAPEPEPEPEPEP